MPVNDTYELRVIGHVLGQEHVHTLHVRAQTLDYTAETLLTEYEAGALAAYRACFSVDDPIVELLHAQMVCGTEPLEAAAEHPRSPFAAQNGSRFSSATRSPTFMASLVSLKTALAGRSRRGRFFLGGLNDTDTDMNSMNPAYMALVQAYCNALTATWITPSSNGGQLVVHSRKLAAVPGTQCQNSSTPVTTFLVSNQPTTMRSRKLGHGG